MEMASASSRILIRLFMDSSIMVSYKVNDNSISQLETTTWDSLGLIRKKEEESITGLERKPMSMKENSREEKEMVGVLSGGQMAAGMRGTSEMEFRADGVSCIVREE